MCYVHCLIKISQYLEFKEMYGKRIACFFTDLLKLYINLEILSQEFGMFQHTLHLNLSKLCCRFPRNIVNEPHI